MNRIENQIKAYAGLGGFVDVSIMKKINGTKPEYYKETWKLSEAEYKTVLNMLNKEDKRLYKILGSNDEFYVKFITPLCKKIVKKDTR